MNKKIPKQPVPGWFLVNAEELAKKYGRKNSETTVYLSEKYPRLRLIRNASACWEGWEVWDIENPNLVAAGSTVDSLARATGWGLDERWEEGVAVKYYVREDVSLRAVEGPDGVRWTAESGGIKAAGGSAKKALTALARSHDRLAGTAMELANKACF